MQVMLIDDHPMLNYGLTSCLEETGRFSVCAQASSLAQAISFIKEAEILPDLVILDILLGEENGLDFLCFLEEFCDAKHEKKPRVLICSVLEDPFRIRTALSLGAAGYISKTGSRAELLEAIDTVLRGEIFISGGHNIMLQKSSDIHAQFTKREKEVLNLVKQNKTNQQIAGKLYISVRTVENHISNIYFKTGFTNRQELIKL